jgi:putative peptide zinc metalloprotease protein
MFVSLAIAYMLFYSLPEQVKVIGLLMGIGAVTMFLFVPLFKAFKYLSTDPELHRKRGRAWTFAACVAGLIFALVGLIQFPVTVRAEGVLEAAKRDAVRVQTPGFIAKIHVRDGQDVQAGDVLVELTNLSEAEQLVQQQSEHDSTQADIRDYRTSDPKKYEVATRDLTGRILPKLEKQKARVERLVIRAPFAGQVVAPQIQHMQGQYLPEGQDVATIVQDKQLEAFVVIDQADKARLESTGGYKTELRLAARPAETVPVASKVMISPAAGTETRAAALTHAGGGTGAPDQRDPSGKTLAAAQFEARFTFDNPGDALPGQKAYVRFKSEEPETLIVQGWRWFKQLTMQTTQS